MPRPTPAADPRPISAPPERRRRLSFVPALGLLVALLAGCATSELAAAGADTTTPSDTTPADSAAPIATTAGATIEVTATDNGYRGLPERLAAGRHRFTLVNDEPHAHELVIFRNPEGRSLDELYAQGPPALAAVDLAAMVFDSPPSPAHGVAADLSPGTYTVVCFLPNPSDGQPQFRHGMEATFVVS